MFGILGDSDALGSSQLQFAAGVAHMLAFMVAHQDLSKRPLLQKQQRLRRGRSPVHHVSQGNDWLIVANAGFVEQGLQFVVTTVNVADN
jgi:hypothetical protein